MTGGKRRLVVEVVHKRDRKQGVGMRTRRAAWSAALAAALALAAGCGSEAKDSGAAAPATVTVTEGIDEAPDAEPTTEADSSTGITDRTVGQQGTDGSLSFKVESIQPVDSIPQEFGDPIVPGAGAKLIAVKVTYRNDGRTKADPFCGGQGIVLIDNQDRNFEFDSFAAISIPGNQICEGAQPGFRSTETVPFRIPAGAKVAAVGVWDSADENDYDGDKTWVRFRR